MTGSHHPWIVLLSILVAIASSHAALSLAQRVSRASGAASQLWLGGGALSLGTGIWSMHFIAMMAFRLPIPLSYDVPTTLVSLALAVAAAGFALSIAAEQQITMSRLLRSALILAVGISGMHYVGMHAITVYPRLTYEPRLFAASIGIAFAASFVALSLFFHLRALRGTLRHLCRGLAAVVMGFAIAGLHYTAMAATRFAPDAWCSGGVQPQQEWLVALVALVALGLLGVTALLLVVDSHLASRARRHSQELQEMNQQLLHAASHDPLTGLPNRTLLHDRLGQAISHGRRHHSQFAVVVFDLDRFKAINDSMGHAAGDEALRQVAVRISSMLRQSDTLARVGGDEFIALLPNAGSRAEVHAVLAKVQQAIGQTLRLGSIDVHMASSIGVAFFPQDAADPLTLLRHADAAMYHAKRHGRNDLQFYAEGMGDVDRARLEVEHDLRTALANGELELHYQPKVDVGNGRVRGAEALLRWRHPSRGLLLPADFIHVAEECGLILPLGEWVLREACLQLRRWHDAGQAHLTMAVNLSAEQFCQDDLVRRVQQAVADAGIAARNLELELTESSVMRDTERSVRLLGEIAALGVRISVDDFGTGYSSLSYLRRLPLHTLKIDRSFIREVDSSREDAEIVRAIVSLAHSLELNVIAEGVETGAQFQFVRNLGCEQYQGYLCSAPLRADDFLTVIERTADNTSSRLRRLLPGSLARPVGTRT